MAQIFISYSRADRQFIDQFIPLIRRVYGNDSLWFDDDIHGGVDWWEMILAEIGKCDLFIYLISNESLESPYCQAELREALRLKKQILPVIVRHLKPPYPGNIDEALATTLRKTQYVDMGGGFRNPETIALLYAAIKHLLDDAKPHNITPLTIQPTPQPPVSDKHKPDGNVRAAYIGGMFLLVSVIIAGIFGLWQGVFADKSSPTTPVVQAATNTDMPEPTNTEISTLTGSEILQTVEAEWTHTAQIQAAFDLTLTVVQQSSIDQTSTAEQFTANETVAYATIYALSDTPTPTPTDTAEATTSTPTGTPTITPTPDPLQAALELSQQGVDNNADWTPYEQEFNGLTMVLVPAGCFNMGSTEGGTNEQPVHLFCFEQPFWISKYEVTNGEFGSRGCYYYTFSTETDEPRICVSWFEAQEFCQSREARLPTEAEWEYAARGVDGLVYPWGNEFVADYVVYEGTTALGDRRTVSVNSYPEGASWVGAMHMSGNVWEWVSSLYLDYPYDGLHEDNADEHSSRVIRGGSYTSPVWDLRAIDRNWEPPRFDDSTTSGFRCARSYNAP